MSNINIEPFSQVTTVIITSFKISCITVNLFNNASFQIELFDANQRIVDCKRLTMTPEQYLLWNNNDQYVTEFVATTLGYIIAAPVSQDDTVTLLEV